MRLPCLPTLRILPRLRPIPCHVWCAVVVGIVNINRVAPASSGSPHADGTRVQLKMHKGPPRHARPPMGFTSFGATTSAYGDILDPAMLRHASSWGATAGRPVAGTAAAAAPFARSLRAPGPRSYQARRSMPARSRPACADRESDQAVGHLAATFDLDQNRTRRRNQTYALREPTAGSSRGGGYAHRMVV
jgi:hypothetical protein